MKNSNPTFSVSGRTKIFLFICLGAIAVVDFAAFVYLAATGAGAEYFILPLIFFVVDAIFILQAVFSNFRFKYTVWEIVFYLLATFAVLVVTLVQHFGGSFSVFTATAAIGWTLIHVLSLIATLLCYLYTAKSFRSNVILQSLVSIILSVACAMSAFAYVILITDFGFFGQGSEVRPLMYEYDESSDSYSVTGVLDGKGENIVVPGSFNGKPVTRVSSSVFSVVGIKGVTLECSPSVAFFDVGHYTVANGLKIYTTADKVDGFKSVFYKMNSHSNFELGNSVEPCGLDEDQVFVSFYYTEKSYNAVNGEILPTWIGKKGDTIDLKYFDKVSYLQHLDTNSDEDLYWCYNNSGYIVSGIWDYETDESLISGNFKVEKNLRHPHVVLKKVFRLFPGESRNDTKFNLAQAFEYSTVGGKQLDYKLTIDDDADEAIKCVKRDGFTTEIFVSYTSNTIYSNLISVETLTDPMGKMQGTDLYIHTLCALNDPEVTCTSSAKSVVYGGEITLSASVVAPVEGMQIVYNWRESEDGYTLCWDKDYTIENIGYGKTGYTLVTTVMGDNTSLVSSVSVTVPVTVTKRPLEVKWSVPENLTYEGVVKTVTCGIFGGIINDDDVSLSGSQFNHRDAGTYSDEVFLTGGDSEKYSISAGQTNSITIERADLTVNWLTDETVYNGEPQSPEVSLDGVYNNEVEYTVSSAVNAATWTIVFTATKGGENYNIKNATASFLIKRYPISVDWYSDCEDTFTYDGKQHAVTATASGVKGATLTLSVLNGTLKNAGTYTLTASVADGNYEITSGATKTYTVNKYGLTVEWGNTKLTYTGTQQGPEYTMRGVEGEGNILGGRNGLQKDVGKDYLTTVTVITEQYDHEKNYYIIEDTASTAFSIEPAEVEVKWQVASYYYYNGSEQAPTAWIVGLGEDKNVSLGCTVEGAINAGLHTAKATLTHALAKNYTLTNTTRSFTIGVAAIAITPQDFTMTYGDVLPERFSYTFSQLAGSDTPDEVFTVTATSVEDPVYVDGYIVPGTYKIKVTVTKGEKGGNYAIMHEEGTLTVKRKSLSVTIDDSEMDLGGDMPEFTYKATGLVADREVIKSYKLFEGEITGGGVYHVMADEFGDGITDLYEVSVNHGELTVKAEVENEV